MKHIYSFIVKDNTKYEGIIKVGEADDIEKRIKEIRKEMGIIKEPIRYIDHGKKKYSDSKVHDELKRMGIKQADIKNKEGEKKTEWFKCGSEKVKKAVKECDSQN